MHDEKTFWENYWQSRIDYFRKTGLLFEDQFRWGYYCNQALYQHYKGILGNINNISILEWGAGSGYVSCLAAQEGAHVTIMDYASQAVRYINIVSKLLKVRFDVKIIQGDLGDINIDSGYDAIWNCGVLEHYSDQEIINKVREMIRLTKIGGHVICAIPNLKSPEGLYRQLKNLFKHEHWSERMLNFQYWVSLFKQAGFRDVRIVPVNYYIPHFIHGKIAYCISKYIPLTKKFPNLAWLFSIVGTVEK